MNIKKIYIGALIGLLSCTFSGCEDDIDPLVEDLELARVVTPIELEARIRNRTTIELEWAIRDDADQYVVEFSEDSLEFNTIIRTVTVTPDQLPVRETFFGDTRYSARVKGISADGASDSKWIATTIRTDSENIFETLENEDIGALEVTITWPAGSEVTHFIVSPGGVNRPISTDEKSAGEATITGLSELTQYTVVMYNDAKIRGTAEFKTYVDTNGAIEVQPTDDLSAIISGAAPDAKLVLHPGTYTYTGTIMIDKPLTIRGVYPYDKPIVNVAFGWVGNATPYNVVLGDIEFNGATFNTVVNLETDAASYGSFTFDGCVIYDYGRQLIYGNAESTMESFIVDNSVISSFTLGGGDFIDFRKTHVTNVTLTNSTFNNTPSGRDFIRIDAASGFTGTGLTTTVLIDHCTLYGLSNTTDRILYVRFDANVMTVQNTLIANTDAYFTNQSSSSQPTCSNNNYFNATGFITPAYVSGAKIDESGNYTTLDPGFVDADNGDFTVTNQNLIDDEIGDPRWRQQ